MIRKSTDILPPYRTEFHPDLQRYVEQFLTVDRISVLKKILAHRTRYLTFIAESLYDEYNIHALIRTSESLGLQDFHNIPYPDVVLKKNKSVTRGAFQWTHIYTHDDTSSPTKSCIDYLRNQGYQIYVSSSNISSHYTPFDIPIDQPLAILMGNEHRGASQEAIDLADGIVTIPMYGFTESYNVSVAGSLIAQPIVERIRKSSRLHILSDDEKKNLYYEWIWYRLRHPDKIYQEWDVQNSHITPS